MARAKESALVLVCAALLAVALTWPIAARFGSSGRTDSGDGRFSVWNVAWVAHALTTDPRGLYDANIFYPHQGALAYSEANLVAGLLAVPVWLLTHNPYAATNWVILCSFALAAISMYALVKHLTGSAFAAARSGIAYAFSPFAFAHLPHIQLLMTFGPPLALLGLHRLVESQTVRAALWLGAALAVQALACGYYGLYGGVSVAFGALWLGAWSGRWRTARYWSLLALAAAVALVLVLPFFAPYLAVRAAGFSRSLDDARLFRAGWRSYLASALLLHRWMLPLIGHWREVLFPGFLAIVLSIVAIVHAIRRRASDQPPRARYVLGLYLVLAALSFWASLGPDAGLYAWLYNTVPFFSLLRAPARFGFFVTVALQVAAGLGVTSLARGWTGRWRTGLVTGIMAFTVARSTVGGLTLAPAAPVSLAYKRLAVLPRGALAEFPYYASSQDRHRQTEYMLMSAYHWQPLINGYSDFTPSDAWEDMSRLTQFPDAGAWSVLRDRQARYVIVHWGAYEDEERRRVREEVGRMSDYLLVLLDRPDASLFQVLKYPASPEGIASKF